MHIELKKRLLGEVILKAIQLDYQNQEKRNYLGISEIAYCVRKLYFQKTRAEKPDINPENLLKMYEGNATHELLQSLLWKHRGQIKNFKYVKAEKQVFIGDILKGHIDLICEIDGKTFVTDFKITGHFKFSKLQAPDDHYAVQLMLYTYAMGLKQALLVYVSKETGKIKEYLIEVDKEIVDYHILKAKYLHYCIKSSITPDIPFKTCKESWECSYCKYKQECWKLSFIDNNQTSEDGDVPVLIESELELEYVSLSKAIDELEIKKGEIKDKIISVLNGSNGYGLNLSAVYIKPTESSSIDKKKLSELVTGEVLQAVTKTSQKTGYYKFNIKEVA